MKVSFYYFEIEAELRKREQYSHLFKLALIKVNFQDNRIG